MKRRAPRRRLGPSGGSVAVGLGLVAGVAGYGLALGALAAALTLAALLGLLKGARYERNRENSKP